MASLLKDRYNSEYIKILSAAIQKQLPSFEIKTFTDAIFDTAWEKRPLKERMRHIATQLGIYLHREYTEAITILKPTFQSMPTKYALENMLFEDFVAVYGMEDFSTSMDALATFTIGSSSEFAIRQFLLRYPKQTLNQMKIWAKSDNEHIRRLASEGSRPRLPWAIALESFKKEPTPLLPILTQLRDDSSEYVRKSVANSLNDISKDHPKLVKKLTKEWLGYSKERDALLKHGCRTLLKESDKETLQLFGYKTPQAISLEDFSYTIQVKESEQMHFSFQLKSPKPLGKLRIEFALHLLRKNGKHNRKVFKITEGNYKEQSKKIQKSYSFAPISTRVYYKGLHRLEILINGELFMQKDFLYL